MRDPCTRFCSALGQWFKNTRDEKILESDAETIATAARSVLEAIQSDPDTLVPELIHFRRQEDFISLNDQRVVEKLYRIEDINYIRPRIENYLGITLDEIGHANQAVYYRNDFVRLSVSMVKSAFLPAWKMLPITIKRRARPLIFKPHGGQRAALRGTDMTVWDVLNDHGLLQDVRIFYERDFCLLEECEQIPER
jgi:hypothetical protein